jgi:hypothetical protein
MTYEMKKTEGMGVTRLLRSKKGWYPDRRVAVADMRWSRSLGGSDAHGGVNEAA